MILICIASASNAQLEEKIKKHDVEIGEIYKDGKTIIGYIRSKSLIEYDGLYYPQPWQYQKSIKFIPKDVFEKTEKIKGKLYDKYNAKDIEGYKIDTLIYKSVKYADMTAVGTGMIAKKMFIKKISDGRISLFYHYGTPPPAGEMSYIKEETINCQEPNLVYQIGENGKVKLVQHLNINKELADCEEVIKAFGKKTDDNSAADNDKPSGIIKDVLLREDYRLSAIESYNKNCQ